MYHMLLCIYLSLQKTTAYSSPTFSMVDTLEQCWYPDQSAVLENELGKLIKINVRKKNDYKFFFFESNRNYASQVYFFSKEECKDIS